MRALKYLAVAVGVVVLLLLGAVIYVNQFDPEVYKRYLIDAVHEATGREAHIDGDARVSVLPMPGMRLEGVRLANAAWASAPDMVTLERLDLRLALWPLLSGETRIDELVLVAPVVHLEADETGRSNWELGGADTKAAGKDGFAFSLASVSVRDASIRYRDARAGTEVEVAVGELLAQEAPEGLAVRVRSSYRDQPVQLEGTVGGVATLLAQRPVPLDLEGSVGDIALKVDGVVRTEPDGRGFELALETSADSLDTLAQLTDAELPAIGPVRASLEVAGVPQAFEARDVDLTAGQSRVSGDLKLHLGAERASVAGTLKTALLDLDELLPEAPKKVTGEDAPAAPPLPADALPFDVWSTWDVDVQLTAGSVRFREHTLEDLVLPIELRAGRLTISPQVTLAGDRFTGVLSAQEVPDGLAVRLRSSYRDQPVRLEGTVGGVATLLAQRPFPLDLEGSVGDMALRAQGAVRTGPGGRGFELALQTSADSLDTLARLTDAELPAIGPVRASLEVAGEPRAFEARNVAVAAGQSRVTGNLKLDLGAERASVAGTLSAAVLDLDELSPEAPEELTEGDTSDERSLRADPLPPDVLSAWDVDVRLTAGSVRFRELTLEDLVLPIDLRAGRLTISPEVTVARDRFAGVLSAQEVPDGLAVRLQSSYRDQPVRLDGTVGGVATLLADGPFPLDLEGSVGDMALRAQGAVRTGPGGRGFELALQTSAESLETLAQLTDAALPAVGPVRASLEVAGVPQAFEARNVAVAAGQSRVTGNLKLDLGAGRASVAGTLSAAVLDLDELSAEVPGEVTEAATSTERLFPTVPLPLDVLSAWDVDVQLIANTARFRKLTLENVTLPVDLRAGRLTISPEATVARGRFTGNLRVATDTEPPAVALRVTGRDFEVGELSRQIRGIELTRGGKATLEIEVEGRGSSVGELMGGSNGRVEFHAHEAQIRTGVLDRAGGDILIQLLGVFIPSREKKGMTRLECAVARFAVHDGMAVADKTLAVQTAQVNVVGGGRINLKDETLDLGARINARKGIRIGAGSLASLVRLRGPLTNPQIGTDLTGVAVAGAKAAGAIATGGLSLIAQPVYGRLVKHPDPCGRALAAELPMGKATAAAAVSQGAEESAVPAAEADTEKAKAPPKKPRKSLLKELLGQ